MPERFLYNVERVRTVPRARRLLSGLGAAALVGLAVGAGPVAAQAAPSAYSIDFPSFTVPAGAQASRTIDFDVSGDQRPVNGVTVKFDAAQLAEVATVSSATYGCHASGTVITCSIQDGMDLTQTSIMLDITTKPGVEIGRHGAITTTLLAGDAVLAQGSSTVTIGEASDLVAGGSSSMTAHPGDRVTQPISVHNGGSNAVHNPVLSLQWRYAFTPVTTYQNCFYADLEAYCEFDADLAVGNHYGLSDALRYDIRADTLTPSSHHVYVTWYTSADATEQLAKLRARDPKRGIGATLGLRSISELRRAALASPQVDTRPGDNSNYFSVAVEGQNRADLQGAAAIAAGAVGDTVRVEPGVKNGGPATVDFPTTQELSWYTLFTVPEGATAVKVPKACRAFENGHLGDTLPGKPQYACRPDQVLKAGDTYRWAFELRIDRAGELTGTVVPNLSHDYNLYPPDLNPANDTATVVINPSEGRTGDVVATSTSLPVTGANVATIAGGGVALVALGGFGYWVARRRSATRFVA